MDVLILGGGIIGCAIALRLRQRGAAVTVVDRGPPGDEASNAAGGILAPQTEAHGPGPLTELLLLSRALHAPWAAELRELTGLDVAYRADGTLALALDDDEAEALRAREAWQRAAGLAVERLSPSEARALEPALGACVAAWRFPNDHQVDNRRLVTAVAQAAARLGVRFVTAQARRVLHDGARATGADLDGTPVAAGQVVVACGAWSSLLDGAGLPPRAVEPVRGQMVELSTRPPPIRHVIFGDDGYLVPRADGRVIVGSTVERVGFVKEVTAAGLARQAARAARLCPALADAPLERSWSGLRPGTADELPLIGPTAIAGLHVATGHYRNGILLAPITAEIVAALLSGEAPPIAIAPFSPLRVAGGQAIR